MLKRHLTGPGAGAMKYDLLTALGAFALGAEKHTQRRVLRLMTLITARYNWAQDEVTVGRAEMARLWGVTERQVKRDLGVLKAMGFIELKRAGARGRVSAYRLGLPAILDSTARTWVNVGQDFIARMEGYRGSDDNGGTPSPEGQGRVIPFPSTASEGEMPQASDRTGRAPETALSEWARMRRSLEATDRPLFVNWFAPLQRDSFSSGRLVLRAPTPFHADYVANRLSTHLQRAAAQTAPEVVRIDVIV